jgi:RimJ/RimL family protein N-acetyltransferase
VDRERLELHAGQGIAARVSARAGSVAEVLDPAYPLMTERLDLRPYTADDADWLYAMQGDPDVTRFLYYGPLDRAQSREALERKIERRALRQGGDALNLVAVLRATGDRVGEASLFWTSAEHRGGEVGYLVHPEHRGAGYATEMSVEMLRLGFEDLGLHRVVARLDARNAASVAVCERLGMRREAHLVSNEYVKGEWCDELDYALLDDEWRSSRPVDEKKLSTSAPA